MERNELKDENPGFYEYLRSALSSSSYLREYLPLGTVDRTECVLSPGLFCSCLFLKPHPPFISPWQAFINQEMRRVMKIRAEEDAFLSWENS